MKQGTKAGYMNLVTFDQIIKEEQIAAIGLHGLETTPRAEANNIGIGIDNNNNKAKSPGNLENNKTEKGFTPRSDTPVNKILDMIHRASAETNQRPVVALDIDDTLVQSSVWEPSLRYGGQTVVQGAVEFTRLLRNAGAKIVLFTSRTEKYELGVTQAQLSEIGIVYDEIIFDKPHYDIFVDNKAMIFEEGKAWSASFCMKVVAQLYKNMKNDLRRYSKFLLLPRDATRCRGGDDQQN